MISVKSKVYGAIGDRSSHPLSDRFATLDAAQKVYPFADSLSAEQDWAALQKAINNSLRASDMGPKFRLGAKICVPPGDYKINRPLVIENVKGLSIEGEGPTSQLLWTGPADADFWSLRNANCCRLADLWLRVETDKGDPKLNAVVRMDRGGTDGWIPSSNCFDRLTVGGATMGSYRTGFAVDGHGPGGDGNNELHRWDRCQISGYTEQAFHVTAGQAQSLAFQDVQMSGSRVGKYGVNCEYGAYIHWMRGAGGYHAEADFYFQDFCILNTIIGWNSESSKRLIMVYRGANCNATPTTVLGCRFESTTDVQFASLFGPGTLNLTGCYLRNGNEDAGLWLAAGAWDVCGDKALIHQGNVYGSPQGDSALLGASEGMRAAALDGQNLYMTPEKTWSRHEKE